MNDDTSTDTRTSGEDSPNNSDSPNEQLLQRLADVPWGAFALDRPYEDPLRAIPYLPLENEIRARALREGKIPAPDVLVDDDDAAPSMVASRWVLRGLRAGPDGLILLTLLTHRHPGDLYAVSTMDEHGAWMWCRWCPAEAAIRWACRAPNGNVLEVQVARLQIGRRGRT